MIKLISTDFDGTLIDHVRQPCFPEDLGRWLGDFQKEGGTWVINTGRSLPHLIDGFELLGESVRPDFVITNEREIFQRHASGHWEHFGEWNSVCDHRHQELFKSASPVFEKIGQHLKTSTAAKVLFEGAYPSGLIAAHEDEMEDIMTFLDSIRHEAPELHHQRNTIYLRFCHIDYSKGTALEHLRDALGIAKSATFAAGDHYNDISMLDGSVAALVACPANAVQMVRVTVLAADGFLSVQDAGEGVLDALRFFTRDRQSNTA